MHNKSGEMLSTSFLAKLLLVIISGLILLTIISLIRSNESDIESSIITCRASVEAREFAGQYSQGTARSAVPMLCKTIDIEIPEDSYDELARQNFTKAVMMNIADRALDCWYMFGEGVFDKNVFGTSRWFQNNRCFTCFTFTIKDERRYMYEPVSPYDLEDFFLFEPYKPVPRNVPFCLHDEDADSGRCIPSDASECIRKGGFCFDKKRDIQAYVKYEGWSCDSRNEVCYVYENMVESYFEYQLSKAPGLFTQGLPLFEITEEQKNEMISQMNQNIQNNLNNENENQDNLLFGDDFDAHDFLMGNLLNEMEAPVDSFEHLEPNHITQGVAINSEGLKGYNKDEIYGIAFISDTTAWGYMITIGTATAIIGAASAIFAKPTLGASVGVGVKTIAAISSIAGGYAGVRAGYGVNDIITGNEPSVYISTLEDLEDNCNVRDDFNQ